MIRHWIEAVYIVPRLIQAVTPLTEKSVIEFILLWEPEINRNLFNSI